ncbi:MAG TPA: SRPBCC family protein [Edaphobacter sp.]|jgi:activator of HSP90 ATPase|nr:SRPBCC family protein [Edaphobacter sp.]
MKENTKPNKPVSTRRQVIAAIAIAWSSQIVSPLLRAESQEENMKEVPATTSNRKRTSIHQEIDFKASPQRIYEALLSSKDFASFTGAPAEIDPKAGGAFSLFGGAIVGRNVELIPNQRIVQAWRPTGDFPEGTYSLVEIALKPQGSGTRLILDHTGFPEGHYDHLSAGWPSHYWEPLKKFLA